MKRLIATSFFKQSWLALFAAIVTDLASDRAHAHEDAPIEHAYYDFLYGAEATLNVDSVLLLIAATGLLLSIRPEVSWRWVLPLFIVGMMIGACVGALGWLPAQLPAYLVAILIGLIAALSLNVDGWPVRVIAIVAPLIKANAMLSGFDWRLIPVFVYLGVAAVLFLGTVIVCLVVVLTKRLLPYPWLTIAWRTAASWVTAISVLMIAMMYSGRV